MNHPLVQIKRVAKIFNGGTPTPEEKNWNGSIAWATPVDLNKVDGGYITSTERTLTEAGVSSGSVKVPAGSVILSTRAPIGYVAIAEKEISFNQGCKALVPRRPDITDSRYLRYAIQAAVEELQVLGKGSTFLELSTQDLASFRIPWPNYQEQIQIADKLDRELSEIDGLIADQQHMADLLEERLKVSIENKILKISGKRTPLRYLAEILPGYAFKSSDFTEDKQGVPLLRGINIGVGNLKWFDVTYLPKNLSSGFENFKLKYNDIVLGLDRPVISDGIRVSLVGKKAEGTLLVQRVARIRAKSNHVAPEWLFLALSSRAFIDYLEPQFTGVSVPHISPQQLANYKIIVPDINTQKEIIHIIKEEIDEVSKIKKDITTSIQIAQSRKNRLIRI